MGETAIQVDETAARAADATPGEAAAATVAPGADAGPAPRQRLLRRGELAQLMDARLEEDEAKDAPRVADAWLERRLRVFERQMAAIESRQDQVEKNALASASAAGDAVRAFQNSLMSLQERIEAMEAKAKAAAIELRTALNEATLRIETVESVARAALAESRPEEPAAEVPMAEPEQVHEPAPQVAEEIEAAGEHHEETAPSRPRSYLDDVRKSAAAASIATEETKTSRKPLRVSRLTRYLFGSVAVLAIFAAGAGMAFSKGVSDGRREAAAQVHRMPRVAVAVPTETPLDRLTHRAQAGDPAAELAIGLRYLDGAQKDPAAAFHWIMLAAVRGQAVAQFHLAQLYMSGTGTVADTGHALQWFEAAALQGNRKAMHALGVAYAQGQGTARNLTEAVRWFSRAANLGYVDSEFDLGVLYERGEGVPQSLLDAYKWYAVAGAQGDLESKERIEALRTQLAPDDLSAAERAARAFRAAPYDSSANTFDL